MLTVYHVFAVCSAKCCGNKCNPLITEQEKVSLYIGVSVAVVASVIIFIVFAVFIFRKIRQNGTDETYLDPTHDFDMTSKPPLDCEDYNTVPNNYLAELSATLEESINTKSS